MDLNFEFGGNSIEPTTSHFASEPPACGTEMCVSLLAVTTQPRWEIMRE